MPSDARPEARSRRGIVAVLVVALLALALAVGLASHHDELSTTSPADPVSVAEAVDAGSAPVDDELLVVCALAILCAAVLAAVALRSRRPALPQVDVIPLDGADPRDPRVAAPPRGPSLNALSISRT